MKRLLLSFWCLVMAFGLYGEEKAHELRTDTLHYLVEKNNIWLDFKSEISIYPDNQVLKRACCQALGIDEQPSLQKYMEGRLNTYDLKVPFSETLYNKYKREKGLGHYHALIHPKGEAVGNYQTFEVYCSYRSVSMETERILQRTFVYDKKNDKVLTVDDIFVPDTSKAIKSKADKIYISIFVQKTNVSYGIVPAYGKIEFKPKYYDINEQDFAEQFKQTLPFDELRAEAVKRHQHELREQQRRDSLRNDLLLKARKESFARTGYKRIYNDFGELIISKQDYVEQPLSWTETTQRTKTNAQAGDYVLELIKNSNGTTDSLWVKPTPILLEEKQGLGVKERMPYTIIKIKKVTGYFPKVTGSWTAMIDIDNPAKNPAFEQRLCKLIFNNNFVTLKDAAESFVRVLKGKKIGKAIVKDVLIRGRSLSYNPGKYYSYAYSHTYFNLDSISNPSDNIEQQEHILSFTKNIIYDIKNQKVLSLSDVLTPEEIAHLGLKKKSKADLGLDNYYLYVGIDGKPLCTYELSRENWNKFAVGLQNLIPPYDNLPAKIDTTSLVFKDYEGIQHASISHKVKQEPLLRNHSDSLLVYLKSHLALPDNMKNHNSWEVQFVVGKDGQVSHVETTSNKKSDADEAFATKLTEAFKQMPAWQPLDVAGLGMQNSLNIYNVDFVPYQILENYSIYESVERDAQFPGGEDACKKWLGKHISYPASCRKQGIQGRVIATFIVNIDGSISDIKILRSPDPLLSKEAERVIKMMPQWKAAMVDGKPVHSRFYLPIRFEIEGFKSKEFHW